MEKEGPGQQNQPCGVDQERLAYSLLMVHLLHQISTEGSFPASSPLLATVPAFLNIYSLTNISINKPIRFIIYYMEGIG